MSDGARLRRGRCVCRLSVWLCGLGRVVPCAAADGIELVRPDRPHTSTGAASTHQAHSRNAARNSQPACLQHVLLFTPQNIWLPTLLRFGLFPAVRAVPQPPRQAACSRQAQHTHRHPALHISIPLLPCRMSIASLRCRRPPLMCGRHRNCQCSPTTPGLSSSWPCLPSPTATSQVRYPAALIDH